jgi:hypothetical protein
MFEVSTVIHTRCTVFWVEHRVEKVNFIDVSEVTAAISFCAES